MTEKMKGMKSPMNTGALKRVFGVLVVLLIASVLMVGAGSADTAQDMPKEVLDAINNANGPTTITLSAGTYNFPTVDMGYKNITFKGVKGTAKDTIIIDLTTVQIGLFNNIGGANLTFDNVTVNWIGTEGYQGLKNPAKVVYKNCIINGLQYLYGDTDFIGCTLENKIGWSVITYSSKNVKFTNCVFNTGGHAVLLYNDGDIPDFVANVNFDGCTFNNDGSVDEQWGHEELVENGQATKNLNKYNLAFTNCKIVGSAQQKLWGNKNGMTFEYLTVFVDGVEVTKPSIDVSGITLDTTDKTYDGTALTTPTSGAVVYDYNKKPLDNIAIDYKWCKDDGNGGYISVDAPKDVGTYYLKASITSRQDIYALTSPVTISQATVIITPNAFTKASGDPETLTYTSSSPVSGEYSKVEGTLSRSVTSEKMGTYVIDGINNLKLVENGTFTATNYKLQLDSTPVHLTINPKVIPADGVSQYTATLADPTDEDNLKTIIETSYGDKFTKTYFIDVSLVSNTQQPTTFIVTYESLGMSKADAEKAEFVVLHLLTTGQTEEIDAVLDEQGLKIGPTTTSPFAICYTVKQSTSSTTGGSSSSQGSSVWLTETPTPTPTETVQPTDTVPTDIPVTQPTSEPASPGFGILAALAGLGCVAALRRR